MTTTIDAAPITQKLRRCFIVPPQVKRIHARLGQLIHYECGAEEPEHLVVLGDTGTGKTTLLGRFCRDFKPTEHPEFTEVPVVYVQVPVRCTVKKLLSLLLMALGSPFFNRGDEQERAHQLVTLLRACKVRMVVIDEVNHLIDRGGRITHYAVGDSIKQTFDAAGVTCVLSGTPRSRLLLETNEQMADRFREVMTLQPFSIESDATQVEFLSVLKAFRGLFGDLPSIEFHKGEVAMMILYATNGRFRQIRRLLVRAIEIACAGQRARVDIGVLSQAFREVIFENAPADTNPFDPGFLGLPLTQAGEPYAPPIH